MDAREEYEATGLVLRRGLLPAEVFGLLREVGERVHSQWMAENVDEARRRDLVNSAGLTASRFFRPPFSAERAMLFDALADGTLVSLVTEVFGQGLYFHGTQIFFNPVGGQRRPYWHRDLQYMACAEDQQQAFLKELCNLHVRLPLRPEKAFMLVPGSHARWDSALEREVRLELSGHRSWEELPAAMAFDLRPGDALVFSANMLHRGTYAGNSARLSLDVMLGEAHPRVPIALDPDQLPTAEELARVRHPGWYQRAQELVLAASTR